MNEISYRHCAHLVFGLAGFTLGLCGLSGIAGCATGPGPASSDPQSPRAAAASSETSASAAEEMAAGERLTWLRGHWIGDHNSETWVPVGDTLVGIGFGVRGNRTAFFEVMQIEERDGVLTLTAMPNGLRVVTFGATDMAAQAVGFANPEHDHPQRIAYQRAGELLHIHLAGQGRPDFRGQSKRATLAASRELDAADRRFAADSAARGADAWAETFVSDGAMWTRRGGRIEGREAIRAAMAAVFAGGVQSLSWEPLHSGLSPRGDLGFTAGRYRLTRRTDDGKDEILDDGSYVTIWQKQPDGRWRAGFDAGFSDLPVTPAP